MSIWADRKDFSYFLSIFTGQLADGTVPYLDCISVSILVVILAGANWEKGIQES